MKFKLVEEVLMHPSTEKPFAICPKLTDANINRILEANGVKKPLTEASLNKVLNGHDDTGYVVLSAYKDVHDKSENEKMTDELVHKLKRAKYSYIPVYGGYKYENSDKAGYEKSFIVYPFDLATKTFKDDFDAFVSDMLEFANPRKGTPEEEEYRQESILVKYPNQAPTYIDTATGQEATWSKGGFNKAKINDTNQEYFTALKKWHDMKHGDAGKNWEGSPKRFTLYNSNPMDESFEAYIAPQPQTLMGAHSRSLGNELLRYGWRADE